MAPTLEPTITPTRLDATLLLSHGDVERLLTPQACADAVEDAFRRLGEGRVVAPAILAMHATDGSFHVKAGLLEADRPYFAAKINANFPRNGARHGLPTIQGAVILMDADDGTPLAIMDSMSITALRTAAASAVAAKYLSKPRCETMLICGCGGQAAAQLRALVAVRSPRRILVHDLDRSCAHAFASAMREELRREVEVADDFSGAVAASDIVVTCTTSRRFFLSRDMVQPGTFVCAVGADHEDKQEIDPALMAASKVVTDLTDQAAKIGDLHHAIVAGAMSREDVHAELAEIVAGRKSGRTRDDEIIVFDSTGTGLQDVAAAVAAYRRAVEHNAGSSFVLARRES